MQETVPALQLIGGLTHELGIPSCHWWLDQPVSNSGRLKTLILEVAAKEGWKWQVDLAMNPDRVLVESTAIVATADSVILDQCDRWFNLARIAIDCEVPDASIVDLSID